MAADDVEKFTADKLDGGNWLTWKYQMTRVLKAKGLFKYVDGTESLPAEATEAQKNTFESKADKALAMITMAIKTAQLYLVTSCDQPVDAWNALKNHFERNTVGNKLLLKKSYFRSEMTESTSVESHLKHMKELADKLATLGAPVGEEDQVATLLGSLPPSYATLVTTLETRSDQGLTLGFVQRAILNEEEKLQGGRRKLKSGSNEPEDSAMVSRKKCFFCKQPGHFRTECPMRNDVIQKPSKHMAKTMEEHVDTDESGGEYTFTAGNDSTDVDESIWFIDSGASRHMTNDKRLLINYEVFDVAEAVGLGDGRKVEAKGAGDVRLQTFVGNTKPSKIVLKDVLYVPDLAYNLFSVRSANRFGGEIRFIGEKCHIYNNTGKLCGSGCISGKLYKLKCKPVLLEEVAYASKIDDIDLWHQRLGHLNLQQMNQAVSNELVTGLKRFKTKKLSFCTGCTEGKLHRKPFKPVGEITSTRTLQLVHSDVCGPMSTASMGGKRYFISFIDDYSRWCCVYLMRTKAEALDMFKKYEKMVTNITGNRITVLRTDRGGEYMSGEFTEYLHSLGIKHELTVAHCPQQNGVAEKMNRTLVESSRAMIYHAGLPKWFWAEALYTTVYTRNRVPTSAVSGSLTPHENWYGMKPNVKHFRVFGCVAYALSFDGDRKKLDKKAQKFRFVGYSLCSKGYRLLDDETKKIFVRRDVVFDECCFKLCENNHNGVSTKSSGNSDQFQSNLETSSIEPVVGHGEDLEGDQGGQEPEEASRPTRLIKPPTRYGFDEYADVMEQTRHVVLSAISINEPKSFKEAIESEETAEGKQATDREYTSLIKKGTWKLVKLPSRAKTVGCRWVFKVKHKNDGEVDRFKICVDPSCACCVT